MSEHVVAEFSFGGDVGIATAIDGVNGDFVATRTGAFFCPEGCVVSTVCEHFNADRAALLHSLTAIVMGLRPHRFHGRPGVLSRPHVRLLSRPTQDDAVGRTTISSTSTRSGWPIATATARAMAPDQRATPRYAFIVAAAVGSEIVSASSLSTTPELIQVARSLSFSSRSPSEMARTACLVAQQTAAAGGTDSAPMLATCPAPRAASPAGPRRLRKGRP